MILFFFTELSLHVSPRNKSRAQKNWKSWNPKSVHAPAILWWGDVGWRRQKAYWSQNCHSSFHSGSFLIRCFIYNLDEHFPFSSSLLLETCSTKFHQRKTFPSSSNSLSLLILWHPAFPSSNPSPSLIQTVAVFDTGQLVTSFHAVLSWPFSSSHTVDLPHSSWSPSLELYYTISPSQQSLVLKLVFPPFMSFRCC